ncbi:MAG: DUF938 domain-containing protein [Rhodobacteraceae bacterium]|nr:DUF938 domain-containing protein [Paracoccaceae bacterium]
MTRKLDLPDSQAATDDGLPFAPSAARNAGPIGDVLARHLPAQGRVLELASGTGQHATAFAARFPGLIWQPSDLSAANLATIRARAARAALPNLRPPVMLDASAPGWAAPWAGQEAVLVVNLLHLVSEAEAARLLAELPHALAPGGHAFLYGPFRRAGALLTPGDRAFDAHLRAQDPAIGYKEASWVTETLTRGGLQVIARTEMPAGNLMLVLRRPA